MMRRLECRVFVCSALVSLISPAFVVLKVFGYVYDVCVLGSVQ